MDEWKSEAEARTIRESTAETELFGDVRTHPDTGTTVATYDPSSDHLSVAVPELVARLEQCQPCSLPPLHGSVDADALDDLLASSGRAPANIRISFRYAGYDVTVDRDALSVTPLQ